MEKPENQTIKQSLALIDRIEELSNNGFHIPATSKVLIDEQDLFELLDHLREFLPNEIQQAQQILDQQAQILQEAKNTAEKLLNATKEKTRQYLAENNLVQQAQKAAEQTRQNAEQDIKRQRYEADKYSEQVLADLEQKVTRALNMVHAGRQSLNQNMQETAQKLGL